MMYSTSEGLSTVYACVCVPVPVCVVWSVYNLARREFSNDNSGGAYADQTIVSTTIGLE